MNLVIAQIQAIANNINRLLGTVAVNDLKPDGTNQMPAGDDPDRPIHVIFGNRQVYTTSLTTGSVSATTGFMLIDLSDTTNWKHVETGSLSLRAFMVTVDPDGFTGSIQIGVLQNVDATDGDFYQLLDWDFTNKTQGFTHECVLNDILPLGINNFGKINLNDTVFNTATNLYGPTETVAYPSGNGDLVMKITRTAGAIRVFFRTAYITFA